MPNILLATKTRPWGKSRMRRVPRCMIRRCSARLNWPIAVFAALPIMPQFTIMPL